MMSDMAGLHVVNYLVEDATDRFCSKLDDEIEGGNITAEQAKEALRFYSDFSDAWDDWCKDAE